MNFFNLKKLLDTYFAQPHKNLFELDNFLINKYSAYTLDPDDIDFYQFYQSKQKAFRHFGKLSTKRYKRIHQKKPITDEENQRFYSSLTEEPIGSWILSFRKAHVISALSVIDRATELLKPSNILDIGCGYGFACDWLEAKYKINCDGIDYTQSVVDYAKSKITTNRKINYYCSDIKTYKPNKKYDLIFSIAGLPEEFDSNFLESISDWLENDGVIIVHIPGDPGPLSVICPEMNELELIYEDVIGGFIGSEGLSDYKNSFIDVLVKKPHSIVPILCDMDKSWSQFADCMNASNIPGRYRNFAYFNSENRPAIMNIL